LESTEKMKNTPEAATGPVLVTGASGMLGTAIAQRLERQGVPVLRAVRVEAASGAVRWDPSQEHPFARPELIEGLRAVVHLSGANVAGKRWTPEYKKEILSSRTGTTTALARSLASLRQPPEVLISASATGIYGDRGEEVLTDDSAAGSGFLSEVCERWEASTRAAEDAGIRVVHLRLGVVLTPEGGALAKMLPPFRSGLGGRLGSGKQWMSWIAREDVVSAVLYLALGHGGGLSGAVNCVAPHPVTNAEFTRELAGVLHRPAFAAVPAIALRLVFGEMAEGSVLASCRTVPGKLLASGFAFAYPRLRPALEHLLAR
jgi:uncharacterized protein (TIGR01777 family)